MRTPLAAILSGVVLSIVATVRADSLGGDMVAEVLQDEVLQDEVFPDGLFPDKGTTGVDLMDFTATGRGAVTILDPSVTMLHSESVTEEHGVPITRPTMASGAIQTTTELGATWTVTTEATATTASTTLTTILLSTSQGRQPPR